MYKDLKMHSSFHVLLEATRYGMVKVKQTLPSMYDGWIDRSSDFCIFMA